MCVSHYFSSFDSVGSLPYELPSFMRTPLMLTPLSVIYYSLRIFWIHEVSSPRSTVLKSRLGSIDLLTVLTKIGHGGCTVQK